MNYKHIWVIEMKHIKGKGHWSPAEQKWFCTRAEAKRWMRQNPQSEWIYNNSYWQYRISKYMGPIKSGCIKEIQENKDEETHMDC